MKNQYGFTLIEVLVALVVLSIGLLGIAALHIDGVRTGYSALQRTYAVNLASDMADRIRANPLGDYTVAGSATPVCADTAAGEVTAICSADAMAAYDIWEWRNALSPGAASGLAGGTGQITVSTAGPVATAVVTVSWLDKGAPRSYQLTVQQ